MRALHDALTTIRRSPYQAIVSILMMTVTFFVAFSFSLLILGANSVLNHFETQPQIIAFFAIDAKKSDVDDAADIMKNKSYVEKVTTVSKEEALKIYQENNQNEPLLLELVTADILPASIEVSATNIDYLPQIKSDLEGLQGIEDVNFQEGVVSQLEHWTKNLRQIGIATAGILGLISFLIIFVIITMKATSKKKAIKIMRLLGATRTYIKAPFMLEGMLYGLVGALFGWGMMYAALLYTTPWINDFLGDIRLLPLPIDFMLIQVSIGTVAGMFIGATAGLMAVSRMIKR